ncbi:hypothetical protein F7R05_17410 [Pseudomonas koreensis]|nr:hypothetical protein F7R05_17410 [Pseudomonas koreensis]
MNITASRLTNDDAPFVGVSLLAIAVNQSPKILTDTALSRAGSLLQGTVFCLTKRCKLPAPQPVFMRRARVSPSLFRR